MSITKWASSRCGGRVSFGSARIWKVSLRLQFSRSRCFTLIELIVSVAIVGILTGLLLPGALIAIAKTKSAKCQSHLRQIGIAMQSYANDHELTLPFLYNSGTPPSTNTWIQSLAPYAGIPPGMIGPAPLKRADGIFICPEFPKNTPNSRNVSYAVNSSIDPGSGLFTWNYRVLNVPAATTLLVVECDFNADAFSPILRGDVTRRHPNQSANFLFVDGHVENIREFIPNSDPRWHRR